MNFIYIILLIIALYYKTYKYNYVIDDICERKDYFVTMTQEKDDPKFYDNRKSLWHTVECICIFIFTCLAIYLNWGWKVALLYAVYPLNVQGVAWKMGCQLYMTSALLLLTGRYFLFNYGLPGLILCLILYYYSMHSGISTIPYALVIGFGSLIGVTGMPLIRTEIGLISILTLLLTMCLFLCCNRFKKGLNVRLEINNNFNINNAGKFSPLRLIVMNKTIAYYIYKCLFPSRLGFFHEAGYKLHNYRLDRYFWLSLIINITFALLLWLINPFMCIWFFGFVSIFSQFIVMNQFVSERYTFLFNIPILYLIAQLTESSPYFFTVIATLYAYRTFLYIRQWRNNEVLFRESMLAFPLAPENANNLASHYASRGRFDLSITPLLYSLKATPINNNANIHINLSQAYIRAGFFIKAQYHTLEALKTCAKDVKPKLEEHLKIIEERIAKLAHHKKTLKRQGII